MSKQIKGKYLFNHGVASVNKTIKHLGRVWMKEKFNWKPLGGKYF